MTPTAKSLAQQQNGQVNAQLSDKSNAALLIMVSKIIGTQRNVVELRLPDEQKKELSALLAELARRGGINAVFLAMQPLQKAPPEILDVRETC